ncbi:MAG TPA: hypothetical protein VG142_06620 [Trebonia sp.]|jgi:hypothetical protein|nr:hypothetical protein [Trebonia sp.]
MPGLMWLSEPDYESAPLCLTFVRGAGEHAVFTGFGADPAEGVSAGLGDRLPWPETEPVVRVARSGGWLIAIEDNIPPQGTRPEVLRRLSADGEVSAADMEAAERSWEATRHLPDPVTPITTDSVREHIQRLLDAGTDKGRIAELGGMTTVGIDVMMAGHVKALPGLDARKILLVEPS